MESLIQSFHHSSHKQKLQELFVQIEKEFEALYEENLELRAKIASLSGGTNNASNASSALRKQTSNDSLGAKTSLGRLRFVKLQKNKLQRLNFPSVQQKAGTKYLMLKDFKEHRDGVWEVSTCPWDVSYFATASADHSARIWSADGSRASVVYLAHTGSVNSVRFHPIDRLVCTSSGDKTCHIWKLPQTSQLKQAASERNKGESSQKPRAKPWTPILSHRDDDLEGPTPGSSPTFSNFPLGDGSRPGSAQMQPLNSSSTNPISIPGIERPPHSHEQSPTNELEEPANNPDAGNIIVRNPLLEIKGHTGPVAAAAWTTSNSVATGSWDNTVRVWSADNARVVANYLSPHDKPHKITNVNTHPTMNIVTFSITDGSFRIWDYRNQDKPDTVTAHQGSVTTAVFTSDGTTLVSGSDDRTVKIWDIRALKSPKLSIRCHAGVNRLAVSSVSSLVAIPSDDKRSSIYDLQGVRRGKFVHYEKCGHKSMVTSAAWSIDESVVFTSGFDRRVVAWAGET